MDQSSTDETLTFTSAGSDLTGGMTITNPQHHRATLDAILQAFTRIVWAKSPHVILTFLLAGVPGAPSRKHHGGNAATAGYCVEVSF